MCCPNRVAPLAVGGYRRAVVHRRRYRYVGPAELRDQLVAVATVAVDTAASLDGWPAGRDRRELLEPFTFVVALDGCSGRHPVAVNTSPSRMGGTFSPPGR